MSDGIVFVVPALFLAVALFPIPLLIFRLAALGAYILGLIVLALTFSVALAGLSLFASMCVFGFLVLVNLTQSRTTIVLTVVFGCLPLAYWIYPLGGVVLAGAISLFSTWRSRGAGFLKMAAGESMAAMGLGPAGLQKPDLGRLPVQRTLQMDKSKHESLRLSVPAFVLAGVLAGAVTSVLL